MHNTITARITFANGERKAMSIQNSTILCAAYHAREVFPAHQSLQLTVLRPGEAPTPWAATQAARGSAC